MPKTLSSLVFALLASGAFAAEPVRKLHLIQDDAQDYMVSKIYTLKYTQANDLEPFVMGMVMRYNVNSAVNALEGANGAQLLTVTCPVEMMPCVDDFVRKADRDVKIAGHTPGDVIRGTGVPWLMDIPYLGWLFSSEATSVKDSELLVLGECTLDAPAPKPEISGHGKKYKHGRKIQPNEL